MNVTRESFLSTVFSWMKFRLGLLDQNCYPQNSNGGWEGWIQVEIAMCCDFNQYDCAREYSIQDERVDFLLNPDDTNLIPVEIKCQKLSQSEADIFEAVDSDAQKIIDLQIDDADNGIVLFFMFQNYSNELLTGCTNHGGIGKNIYMYSKIIQLGV